MKRLSPNPFAPAVNVKNSRFLSPVRKRGSRMP